MTCPNVVNLLRPSGVSRSSDKGEGHAALHGPPGDQRRRSEGILADVSSRIADINTNIRVTDATVGNDHRGSIR
jgi:hypothetical protein